MAVVAIALSSLLFYPALETGYKCYKIQEYNSCTVPSLKNAKETPYQTLYNLMHGKPIDTTIGSRIG